MCNYSSPWQRATQSTLDSRGGELDPTCEQYQRISKHILKPTTTAGLGEAQAGIKIAGRNINNLRYADDTTLVAASEEERSVS